MKCKIEKLTTQNKCNAFYFRCTNCEKIIPPIGENLLNKDRPLVCDCGQPNIGDTILIDTI